jgi:hypothetical protein
MYFRYENFKLGGFLTYLILLGAIYWIPTNLLATRVAYLRGLAVLVAAGMFYKYYVTVDLLRMCGWFDGCRYRPITMGVLIKATPMIWSNVWILLIIYLVWWRYFGRKK